MVYNFRRSAQYGDLPGNSNQPNVVQDPLVQDPVSSADPNNEIPLFGSPFDKITDSDTGEEYPDLKSWMDDKSVLNPEDLENIKSKITEKIDDMTDAHAVDEGMGMYWDLKQSQSPTAELRMRDIINKLYDLFKKHELASNPTEEKETQSIEENIPEVPKYNELSDQIQGNLQPMTAFNFKKFQKEAVRLSEPYILNGPEETRLCPKIRNVVSEYICRWHCIDGLILDDYRVACAETIYRQNIIDKYSREYRDKDGNYIGGYLNKRFEIHYDTAGNSYQLKPGERRRPISPDEWSTEKRLSKMREESAEKREYVGGTPEPEKTVIGSNVKMTKTAGEIVKGFKQALLDKSSSATMGMVKEAQATIDSPASWSEWFYKHNPGVSAESFDEETLNAMGFGEAQFSADKNHAASPKLIETVESEIASNQDIVNPAVINQHKETKQVVLPTDKELNQPMPVEQLQQPSQSLPPLAAEHDGVFYKDGVWRSLYRGASKYHNSEKEAIRHFAQQYLQEAENYSEKEDMGVHPENHPDEEEALEAWEEMDGYVHQNNPFNKKR